MKKLLLILVLSISLPAKIVTPSEVYSLAILIQEHLHFLHKHYDKEHNHDFVMQNKKILSTDLKPRNNWQKTYEILVKINMLRETFGLPRIEPVGITAKLNMQPIMVYEMNERILTELKLFEFRQDIKVPEFKKKVFHNKTPLDVYNVFVDISASLDDLNERALTPSYVYSEAMRIYDDIGILLNHLQVHDNTAPEKIISGALPRDAMNTSVELKGVITNLQKSIGLQSIDFSEFYIKKATPSDVFTMTGFIISELQPIKAYFGLTDSITPPALTYKGKKPENVEQLMRWNYKRLKLIEEVYKGRR